MVDKAGVGENKMNKSEMIKDHPHFRIMDKLANVKAGRTAVWFTRHIQHQNVSRKNGGDEDSYMVTKVTNHSSTPHSPTTRRILTTVGNIAIPSIWVCSSEAEWLFSKASRVSTNTIGYSDIYMVLKVIGIRPSIPGDTPCITLCPRQISHIIDP